MNKNRLQTLSIIGIVALTAVLGDRILRSPLFHNGANVRNIAQSSNALAEAKKAQVVRINNYYAKKPLTLIQITAPKFNQISLYKDQPINTANPVTTPRIKIINPVVPTVQATLSSLPAPKSLVTDIINSIPDNKIADVDPQNSVVNILCKLTENGITKNISSSGVVISNSGLILTNAHVAVHPFLDAYSSSPITCSMRYGSPALNSQTLSFIYISPYWTKKHIGETSGTFSADTGEYDFAILKINPIKDLPQVQKVPLRTPANTLSFNQDSGNLNQVENGQAISLIGYPISLSSAAGLYKRVEPLTIESVLSFNYEKDDLIETSISKAGKSGASGGAIIDSQKYLVGLVANIIPSLQNPSETKVRALTLDHINQSLRAQAGISFYDLINSDGSGLKKIFEEKYLGQVSAELIRYSL